MVINVACLSILYRWGIGTFTALFWFKITSLVMAYYLIGESRSRELNYYKNLGLSKQQLWAATLSFDFTIFLIVMLTILTSR